MTLEDYNILYNWRIAGNSIWQITTRKGTGREYFIKRYLCPIYPVDWAKNFYEKAREADEWFHNRKKIFDAVERYCGPNGSLVTPVEFFREGNIYYKITYKLDVEKGLSTDQISKLPMNDRLRILEIISSALQVLHDEKLVLADLKPDNILIDKGYMDNYIPRIIDLDDCFYEGQPPDFISMTPEYCSPEVIMYYLHDIGRYEKGECEPDKTCGDKITCKSDIFALGLIFHEYLTGKRIEHDGYTSIGGKALHEELTLDESLTPCLSELLQSMVQKDYTKRPSIDKVIEALINCDNYGNSKTDDDGRVVI